MAKTAEALDDPLSERLRRGDVFSADCPSRQVMRRLTSSWGVLALIALQNGTLRFSALRRRMGGVSDRMLAQTLKGLEADGLVDRRAHDLVPPHVDYTLSPLGREAALRVGGLADWIEDNIDRFTISTVKEQHQAVATSARREP